ncbi:MAG: phosphoribosylaminoimidazolesuccinocarboxamide synthase [Cyanobacteria bacterium SBLK]|nr:phosphoribosylaminoimidazolesuccinocarboxamide synthase [Cyanobacteria bacterium SBLK]
MSQLSKLYEGKAKILYATEDSENLLAYFKDDATAFNAQKRGTIQGKGEVNCTVSSVLFQYLEERGIPTHYLEQTAPNRMRVRAVKIFPLEVVVRNIAAGSLCKQTNLPLGRPIREPLVEFYYKNDDLGDPLLTRDRILLMELASVGQVEEMVALALQIDRYLTTFFEDCGITLVDFKIEFGLDARGQIRLADEISPDTCRLWDAAESDPQRRVMDKDRFRHDLGQVESTYRALRERVLQAAKIGNSSPSAD